MIGLPLLACLHEHELRSLVAHELAQTTFPRPDLVLPLAHRWRELAIARSDDEAAPEDQLTERDLRNFALAVERVADAAAVDAAGNREAAARAIAMVDGLEMTQHDFLHDLGLPRPSMRQPARQALEDIDEVWRRILRDGLPIWMWDEDVAVELAHKHPTLAEPLLDLAEADVALRLPRSPIRLRPLDRRSRRRLARGVLSIPLLAPVRWHTVETAPPQWWMSRASRSVERLRSDVAEVLGREPVDHAEMAEVVLVRSDELVAVRGPVRPGSPDCAGEDEPDDEPQTLAPILRDLVEDALLPRGWRLEHPVIRGVLIGPRGEKIDTNTLTAGTYLDGLRELLMCRGPGPARRCGAGA